MKKASLVDQSLLAEVEQESPAVYAYYNSCPFSRFTFIDYSSDNFPMLMKLEAYEYLQAFAKTNSNTIDEVLEPLRVAYNVGVGDLYRKLRKYVSHADKQVEHQYILMSIALNNYPLQNFDKFNKLLDAHIDLDSITVIFKTAYMDAIFYESWKQVLKQHASLNELFMKINLFKLKNISPENMNFSLS